MEWGGQVIWTAPITDVSGAAGPVLFDFEMDGYPEVLFADEQAIRFFSGLDGQVKFTSNQHSSYTILETPIVADVDGDNQVEIVLGHCTGNAQYGSITVYGDADKSWPPGRKIWNQHTYHITNVNNLGGIPSNYQSNWAGNNTFNSFRSGDVGQPPGEYHDLQPEILGVCEDKCKEGTFYMAARIRNAGNLEVPAGIPVTVRAGIGGPIVATLDTKEPIPPGKTGEVLFFEFEAKKLAQSQPVITVDDTGFGDGAVFECDELNNTAVWPEEVCPTITPG
ncbi:MAG TPA: VCBS repeat-containing protein, partial [Nannocystis sp.]